MFDSIRYLEWIRDAKTDVTGDLGSSGLGAKEEAVVPETLRELPDPTDGTALEAQIAAHYDDSVSTENVLVAAGATHGNLLAYGAALGASEADSPSILVEQPAYEPLYSTPRALGARVRRVERDPEEAYTLDPDTLAGAIDDSTAMVVISNRHNPSGQLATRADLEALAVVCRERDAPLLVDEVYAPYQEPPERGPGTAFGGPTAAGIEGVVVTNSFTKFFGLGGLKIGWVITDPSFIERAAAVESHVPSVAEPSRALARRAFESLDAVMEEPRTRLAANSALLEAFVASRPELDATLHEGSTFAFPAHESADGNEVFEAANEAGLLVVPGRFYENPARFRLSIGGAPEDMEAALDRFGEVLDSGV